MGEAAERGISGRKMQIPPTSVLVCDGYVQQRGSEWRGEQYSWYHSYLMPENRDLLDAVDVAYRDSNALGLKKPRFFQKEVWTSKG